jgi:hypothetical protein
MSNPSKPWPLAALSQDNVELYYGWAAKHFSRFNKDALLCNWFPLRVLVEFAAENGVRLKLDYWRGQAPVNGKRFWDTAHKLILDSHDGTFAGKSAYLKRAQNTVTARMIGNLNTVPIEQSEARPGDLIARNYSESFWHIEFITQTAVGVVTTEAGSTPAIAPKDHRNQYSDIARSGTVYENKPRRWEFSEVFGTAE